jgi:cobalt-zinc-cadmium efflux system protein
MNRTLAAASRAGQSGRIQPVEFQAMDARSRRRGALLLALAANAALMGAEIAGGFVFRSLALLSDAVHLLTDVSGLGIALLAIHLQGRPTTRRHSFGLQRAEVLAAQANAFVLVGVTAWIAIEAARRLVSPVDVSGGGMAVVAAVGLVVNLGSARLVHEAAGRSLNMRGAFLHLATDAAGSAAALIAGVAILLWDVPRADPIASLVIGCLVLWAAWTLLRDTTHVLLEGTPEGLDPASVEAAIAAHGGVESVHHLHLWSLASDVPALSAHVVLTGQPSLHDAQVRGDGVKAMLAERFGIDHATLELECHQDHPSEVEF